MMRSAAAPRQAAKSRRSRAVSPDAMSTRSALRGAPSPPKLSPVPVRAPGPKIGRSTSADHDARRAARPPPLPPQKARASAERPRQAIPADAGILEEFNQQKRELEEILRERTDLEDRLTRATAVNSVLLERMADSSRAAAYLENARLRREKRELMDALYAYSSDILVMENFAPASIQPLVQLGAELRGARRARSERLFDLVRAQTLARLSESDSVESELQDLTERKSQLKKELEKLALPQPGEMSSERLIEDAKRELRDVRAESLHLQLELFETRVIGLQMRIESETMQLRRTQLERINRLKQTQNELKEKFLPLQEEWNQAMCRNGEFEQIEELERLQASFGQTCDQIESIASDGARAERDLLTREMDEIQGIHAEIKKFTSDTQLRTLASQARFEALERQISILKQSGSTRDMNEAIAEEARQRDQLNAVMQESLRKLKELDQLLGNDDTDLPLDARFQSIQERIAVILEEVDPPTLTAREQKLKSRLNQLRRAHK
jgi:hypothetical protein